MRLPAQARNRAMNRPGCEIKSPIRSKLGQQNVVSRTPPAALGSVSNGAVAFVRTRRTLRIENGRTVTITATECSSGLPQGVVLMRHSDKTRATL